MTERFNVMLPGMEQEFEVGLPTLETEGVVFTIVTRQSKFISNKIQIIITCNMQEAEEDYILMKDVTFEDGVRTYMKDFDFYTNDLGLIHIEVEFIDRHMTWITISF